MTNKEIKLLKNKLFLNSDKYISITMSTIFLSYLTWLLSIAVF